MKHSRFTKLFVLILSLALLIGSAVCVAASADEGADYGIKSVNIAHGDKIQVLIAVDAPNLDAAEAEQLTVTYTYNGETIEADYWKMMDIYKNGTLYPVFYTVGIAMKDIGEAVVAQVGNGAPMNISVADYLYTKLAKDGYAFATEGEDAGRKNLYLTLLNYGAQAQEVLWNNNHPDELRTLVTSVIPVYAANGVTVDGQSGLLKLTADDLGRVDLAYNGGGILDAYKITDANGVRYVSAGNSTAYVTGLSKIEPVIAYQGATLYDFEGEYTDETITVKEDTTANVITFADGSKATYDSNRTNYGGARAEVVTEDGNSYLRLTSPERGTTTTNDRAHSFALPVAQALSETPNVTVLQFDFLYNSSASYCIEFSFAGKMFGLGTYIGDSSAKNPLNLVPRSEWHTIRLEAYYEQDVIQAYVDGLYVGDVKVDYYNAEFTFDEFDTASFACYNANRVIDVAFDNVTFVKAEKEYVAVPVTKDYIVETFDAGWEYGVFSGAATPETNQEVKAADGLIYSKMDGNGRTNAGKTYSEIVNDGVNSYLRSYSPGRDGISTNRSHSMYFTPEKLVKDEFINTTVLEFDIKVEGLCSDTEGLTFAFTAADDKYLRFCCNNSLSFVDDKNTNYAPTYQFASVGTWTRVKFVVDYAAKSISLYSNGVYVGELNFDNATLANMSSDWSNVAGSAFASAQIYTYNGGGMCAFGVDNVSFYHTYIAPAAE